MRLSTLSSPVVACVLVLLLSLPLSLSNALPRAAVRCPAAYAPSLRACRLPATAGTPLSGSGNCCTCPGGSYSPDGAACRRCTDGSVAQSGVDSTKSGAACSCIAGYGDYDTTSMTCRRCPMNTYSLNNQCVACAAGTFAAAQSSTCAAIVCPADSYLPPGGATLADCTRCKFGTAGQSCDNVQGCKCLAGYAGFDKTTGQCVQCGSNAIAVYADMTKKDETATVCAECPAAAIASQDRRTCVDKKTSVATFPTTPIPAIVCVPNVCFLDTETTFALDTPQLQSRVMSSIRSPLFANQSNTFQLEFERRLVDDADQLCASTGKSEACSLPLRRVQLLHLRSGDYIFTPRATGIAELRRMHFLAHADKPTASADITTLYYRGANGALLSLSLTVDHVLLVVPGTQSVDSLPTLPVESDLMTAPLSDRDLMGDSGPLSMWQPSEHEEGYLLAASKIEAGDYIWHQPLPGAGADLITTGSFRLPLPKLVRVERVTTEVQFNKTLQVPIATSSRYSISGVVANLNSVRTALFVKNIRFASPTIWMLKHWPYCGHIFVEFIFKLWSISETWVNQCIFDAFNDPTKEFTFSGFVACSVTCASESNSTLSQWMNLSLSSLIVAALFSIGAASVVRGMILKNRKNTAIASIRAK